VFDLDDPTDELSAAWGVKEQLRRLLKTSTIEPARTEKMVLGCYVVAADMEVRIAPLASNRRRTRVSSGS
jgi:transposase